MTASRTTIAFRQSLPLLIVFMSAAMVAWLAYGVRHTPVLYSDDWAFIVGQYVHDDLKWLDWYDRRPLIEMPLLIVTGLFGLNTGALYLVLIALQVIAAWQLYALLRRCNAGPHSFALLVSLLFLVFPADYTRTWLTMIPNWVAMNLLLVYAHLLLSYAAQGRIWLLIAANLVLLVSLGIYEAQLGLALAWALLLPLLRRGAPRARRLALLTPLVVGLIFTVWRTVGVPAVGGTDPYLQHLRFTPLMLSFRAVYGLAILIWSWAVALREALQVDSKLLLIGLVVVVVVMFALIGFIFARVSQVAGRPLAKDQRIGMMRKAFVLMALGGTLAIAGFMPVTSIYLPNLSGVGSRVNLFAIPGASLSIGALLWLIALLLGRKEEQINLVMMFSALPLLLIGVWTQAWVRQDATLAWQEQKMIWAGLTKIVPNLVDDTAVYIVLPDEPGQPAARNWRRTALTRPWDVSSGLQVLYDNESLQGNRFLFSSRGGLRGPRLLPEGVTAYPAQEDPVPYAATLFVIYDGATHAVRIVEDLEAELSLPWTPTGYAPQSRITEPPASGFPHRWLVDLAPLSD